MRPEVAATGVAFSLWSGKERCQERPILRRLRSSGGENVDGTLSFVFHDSIAADGSEHLTSKRVPTAVTLTDGSTTTVYRLVRRKRCWRNLNLGSSDSFEFTDVTMFTILAPGGGIVDRVASVTHVGPTGSEFSFTFGECEPPQG